MTTSQNGKQPKQARVSSAKRPSLQNDKKPSSIDLEPLNELDTGSLEGTVKPPFQTRLVNHKARSSSTTNKLATTFDLNLSAQRHSAKPLRPS